MELQQFRLLLSTVTSYVAGKPLDAALQLQLNVAMAPVGATYRSILAGCHAAIEAGWMCNRESAGIKYGRVIKPGPDTHGFSVDVVDMSDTVGPHHRHPHGEIDLIMPLTDGAIFDGQGAGWRVYGPDSAHSPTVAGGRALILYLLPDGKIEFTP
jgi:hypothetical protein